MNAKNQKPNVAVILAGGYGKRLLPHTQYQPKALLCVDGSPLIDRTFIALSNASISTVFVVAGYLGNLLEEYIKKTFSSDFEIKFVRQYHITGSADALSLTAAQLKQWDHNNFLVLACDYLLPEFYLHDLINFHTSGAHQISISLRTIEAEKISESNFIIFGPDDEIVQICEKPQKIQLKSQYTCASLIYVLPHEVFRFIDKVGISERGEKELPAVLNLMITSGMTARGLVQAKLLDWEAKYRGPSVA